MPAQPDPTELLADLSSGDLRAADELLPLVHGELRELAQRYLGRERPDHTLQPTALVHEAYLKLIDQTRVDWKGRTHFKAVAARILGRILVDHARAIGCETRGGQWRRVPMYDAFQLGGRHQLNPLDLTDALEKMRALDERQTSVAELRLFGGLTGEETARILEVSVRTAERDWKMGQAWLRRELSRGASE